MAEICDAIGGQLGAIAANEAVERGGGAQDRLRDRNADRLALDGAAEERGEFAMAVAARMAIVGLDRQVVSGFARGERDQQSGEIVGVE